jgi:CHAT domain-containing protein/tetratricopeptide (TPR) repeat protein
VEGKWKPCGEVACGHAGEPKAKADQPQLPRLKCDHPIDTPDIALTDLLEQPECTDSVIEILAKRSADDLSAAYYLSADRNGRAADLFRGLGAAMATLHVAPQLPSARFNQALLLERMWLNEEAVQAWNQLEERHIPGWSREAQERAQVIRLRNGLQDWRDIQKQLDAALETEQRVRIRELVKTFPFAAQRHLTDRLSAGMNRGAARLLAEELVPVTEGDRLATDITLGQEKGALRLEAQLTDLGGRSLDPDPASLLPETENVLRKAQQQNYLELAARVEILKGHLLTESGNYIAALDAYDAALDHSKALDDKTGMVRALHRRSGVYELLGAPEQACRDVLDGLQLRPEVVELREVHSLLGSAARAAVHLDQPEVALLFQAIAVRAIEGELRAATDANRPALEHNLTVALRDLADYETSLNRTEPAKQHLIRARELLTRVRDPETRRSLEMRLEEVQGRALLKTDPNGAIEAFTRALGLIRGDYPTLRALLHKQRADALKLAGRDAEAEPDLATALAILKQEEAGLLAKHVPGRREEVWSSYMSRSRDINAALIRSLVARGRHEEAFLRAEESRAAEPLGLILHSGNVPPPFRELAESRDIARISSAIPEGTFIIEFAVLNDETYAWVVWHGGVTSVVRLGATRTGIKDWTKRLQTAADHAWPDRFGPILAATYDQLLRTTLSIIRGLPGGRNPRLVIVPDDAMQGLPFSAMTDVSGRPLIKDAPVALAGSVKLYLYSLMRDRELAASKTLPSILLVGNPRADSGIMKKLGLLDLYHAEGEVREIKAVYGRNIPVTTLTKESATVPEFLRLMRDSAIVHVAAHGLPNEERPLRSMILFAPSPGRDGTLTAIGFMEEMKHIDHTRLIVLAACSSVGGVPVGPEGVAPLVRPLIAGGVPAVVGALWPVEDATAQQLMVSFHRHYREGSDVAEALRQAQLELLNDQKAASNSPLTWPAFQVIGYAGSPFESPAPLEDLHNVNIHHQDSLQRSHGVRPK